MRNLSLEEMENVQGALGCSDAEGAALIAGAAIGGALFFGVGGIVTGYTAMAFWVLKCHSDPAPRA